MDLNHHGTEEQLELYARGKLPPAEVAELEEHLLVCTACLERLEEAEQWTQAVREALQDDAKTVPASGWKTWPVFGPAFSSRFGLAATGVALVALVAAGIAFLFNGDVRLAPVATLQLAAVRGEMVSVEPAREFDLVLADAPPAGGAQFRVQVVDGAGMAEWEQQAPAGARGIEVKVQKTLKSGNHFVRLYGPNGEMLHEYGFRVN